MSRIIRSTDIQAALRSRQRGFLLNPFRFGGGGGGNDAPYSTDLTMWFDASDAATLTEVSGKASAWTCKKTGTTWSQGTGANRPLIDTSGDLGAKCLNFSKAANGNVNAWLTGSAITLTIPFTCVIAIRTVNFTTYHGFMIQSGVNTSAISGGTARPAILLYSAPPDANMPQFYSTGSAYPSGSYAAGKAVYSMTANSTTASASTFTRNGVTLTPVTGSSSLASSWPITTMGSTDSTYASAHKVGEILIYNRALDSTERSAVRTYLNAKWGIP